VLHASSAGSSVRTRRVRDRFAAAIIPYNILNTAVRQRLKHRPPLRSLFLRIRVSAGSAGRWLWSRIRENPLRLLLAVIAVPFIWYVYTEATREVIVIEAVSVPKPYEELGFTSAVMTLRIAEKLQQIEQSTNSRSKKDQLIQSTDTDVPDIEVPATTLSLKTIVQLVQQVLHHEPERVRGEITWPRAQTDNPATGGSVAVWYHIYNGSHLRRAEKEDIHTRDPDEVVQQYAEGLLKRLNPYLWVLYLGWNKNDLSGARAAAESIIASTSDHQLLAKAYTLIGNVLHDQGKRDEAVEKYLKAIDLDPKYSPAYNHWGNVLHEQGKRDEAIEKFQG
jgi:tetratricopeptide (TPR) repeat protein